MSNLHFTDTHLPIHQYKSNIIEVVRNNQVTVIYGNTGCGKTTQIPQYILEAKLNNDKMIAITQPWKVAAMDNAKRVAELLGCICGKEVGYEVRTDSQCSESTKIKYMTDEMMLDKLTGDASLSQYGVVMVDEAHERTIASDFVLGILKSLIKTRSDLKVIISSATAEKKCFSIFFDSSPIIRVSSSLYQVVPIYEPIKYNKFVDRSVNVVTKTMKNVNTGDYLIFLPNREEIKACSDLLCDIENISVFEVDESVETFANVYANVPSGHRKVIITNNVGETMFALPSVRYVIDCGLVTEDNYDEELESFISRKKKISKDRADMRAFRAGCSKKGWCYRIYRGKVYDNFSDARIPEIKRKDLWEYYVKLQIMGLDPASVDFIDRPDVKIFKKCEEKFKDMFDGSTSWTDIKGIPLSPVASKLLLSIYASSYLMKDVVTMMVMLNEPHLFDFASRENHLSGTCYKTFDDEDGDHFSRLNIYNEFVKNGKTKKWCYLNYLSYDALLQIDRLRDDILKVMEERKRPLTENVLVNERSDIKHLIMKEYYRNLCVRKGPGEYISYINRRRLYLDPNSSLLKESPQLILYHECVYNYQKPIIYGILKIEEVLLESFPNEMTKINYRPGVVPEKESHYSERYDPFEGDNYHDHVPIQQEYEYYYDSSEESYYY